MSTINDSYGRDLDLNLLRVFAVVAEEQNITRAASRLYVTQPAISAAIRRLTSFVGADLVMREGRGVALTKRGIDLLVAARAHLQPLVAAAMAVPVFDPKASTATVRIGLVDGMEVVVLPTLLALLRSEAPRMQIVVVPAQFRTIEELLLSTKVDVALCVADDLPRSIVRQSLISGTDTLDGFACLYDPRFSKVPKTLTAVEYLSREHVVVSYAGDARGIIEDAVGEQRIVRVAVPNMSLVAEVVDGSALLGTIPTLLARHVLKTRPHLRYRPLPFTLDEYSLDMLWRRAAGDDKVVSFMRELLTRVIRELVASPRAQRANRPKEKHQAKRAGAARRSSERSSR